MSSFYSLHFSSLAIRLLLEQASLWEPHFFLESLLLICFGQEDKQASMCRLRIAPCLPFHWTNTMNLSVCSVLESMSWPSRHKPCLQRSFHLAGEEAVSHEGSEGKAFLEFRGGLSISLDENGFRPERQGFEQTKINGKPISEAISKVWRDKKGKESAKKWLNLTRAWSVGRWVVGNKWPKQTGPGS